jgi:hypothetical protein
MEKDSIEIIAASHIDDVPPDDIDMKLFLPGRFVFTN